MNGVASCINYFCRDRCHFWKAIILQYLWSVYKKDIL